MMKNEKKTKETISVIIPVYNAEKYIEGTVGRVNQSTIKPYEIILVNDGSTDCSLQKCKELKQKYDNVKVVDKQNEGIAEARNTGIENATGKYICFTDQDDYVDATMYEKVLNQFKKTSADVVMVSTGQIVNEKIIPYEQLENDFFEGAKVQDVLLKAFLFRGYEKPCRDYKRKISSSIWKCVITRELIEQNNIRFKRFINYEDDYIMMATLLCFAKKVVTMSHVGYYWLNNSNSESHRVNYIANYGQKVKQLYIYMEKLFIEAGIDENTVSIFKDQLVFEKIIDVIANAYSKKNIASANDKFNEVEEYVNEMCFFERNLENVKPLPNFHRLCFLYKLYLKKNIKKVILGVNIFLHVEYFIHNNYRLMRFFNARK